LNKEFYETHTAYWRALWFTTCSSNWQFELKVTHANAISAQPRFKNVIFRHHYVMQKNSRFTKIEQRCFCTSTDKM